MCIILYQTNLKLLTNLTIRHSFCSLVCFQFEKETMTAIIQDAESGIVQKRKAKSSGYITSRILMQAFTMTFLAEWGDRSQLTTIILGAREDIYGVIVGGILGHSLCTGLAVIGGRIIAQRISVRTGK